MVDAVLDNPVWHALTGPQATVAEGSDRAKRYLTDVAAFAALPDEPVEEDWAALADLVGPAAWAVLFRDRFDDPGWARPMVYPCVQMIGADVEPDALAGVVLLGVDDVAEMLDLTQRTQPGPFSTRTHELGTYLGVRDDDGRLVAMAGERMRPNGITEISAVCTDDTHRGRGLAAALVRDLVGRIKGRGELPILHVEVENPARRLYERLGFTERMSFDVTVLQTPD